MAEYGPVGITEWFVDVQDTGGLHIAAMINHDTVNERILAYSEPCNFKYTLSLYQGTC